MPFKALAAAAVVAAAIPLYAGPTAATPLSQAQALQTADLASVEQVQYRRQYRNEGYDDGYYAYGAAPIYRGYDYGYPAYGYRRDDRWGYSPQAPGPGSSWRCTGDRAMNSAFPSWMCR